MTSRIRTFVGSKTLHHVIIAAILLAEVVAGLETSPTITAKHTAELQGLDQFSLGIFIVEALLRGLSTTGCAIEEMAA